MTAFRWLCPGSYEVIWDNAVITEKLEHIRTNNNSWDGHTINYFIKQLAITCSENVITSVFQAGNLEKQDFNFGCNSMQLLFTGHLFTPVCFTFNSLLPDDLYETNVVPPVVDHRLYDQDTTITGRQWSTDNMEPFTDNIAFAPKHVYSNKQWSHDLINGILRGGQGVLLLFYKQNYTHSTVCGVKGDRSRILLHHPGEVPMVENTRAHNFQEGKTLKVYVTPKLITADIKLAKYEPARRGCYFAHEHKLSLFKFYTEKNCQMECTVNTSLAACGCVPFYLPLPNDTVPVCENFWLSYNCLQSHMVLFFQNPRDKTSSNDIHSSVEVCNCLPDCNSLSYDFEVVDETTNESGRDPDLTEVAVSYKDARFSTLVRYETKSLADFVADSGGILGVFCGFSFIAICEVLYFLTFKLWSNVKRTGQQDTERVREERQVETYTEI